MTKGLPISNCKECPYKDETDHYSSDGWDRMCSWICSKADNRKIAGGVEWYDKIPIPVWCPLPNIDYRQPEVPPLKDQEGNIVDDRRGNEMGA